MNYVQLAEAARTSKYGSQAHEDAINALCAVVEKTVSPDEFSKFENWALKATSLEIVDRAEELLR